MLWTDVSAAFLAHRPWRPRETYRVLVFFFFPGLWTRVDGFMGGLNGWVGACCFKRDVGAEKNEGKHFCCCWKTWMPRQAFLFGANNKGRLLLRH